MVPNGTCQGAGQAHAPSDASGAPGLPFTLGLTKFGFVTTNLRRKHHVHLHALHGSGTHAHAV